MVDRADLRTVDHLLHRADFQAVMAAEVVSRTAHFVLHRRLAQTLSTRSESAEPRSATLQTITGISRVGAVLPKRLARRAVTRNTLKRQIYTVMRDYESRLPQADHVVRLRAPFDREQFTSANSPQLKRAARLELEQLLTRAVQS